MFRMCQPSPMARRDCTALKRPSELSCNTWRSASCRRQASVARALPISRARRPMIPRFASGEGPDEVTRESLLPATDGLLSCLERSVLSTAAAAITSAAMVIMPAGHAFAGGVPQTYSGVDDAQSDLVQGLLKKSKENKAKNDQDRLDRFYKKEFAINKILGTEVLPEACDPRDPEYGYKCLPRLPRLPEDRLNVEQGSSGFQGFGGLTPTEEPEMFK